MKKILTIALTLLLCQTAVFAQKKAKTVNESEVPARYVKDFQRQAPDVKSVVWTMIDSNTYDAVFTNANNIKQGFHFTNKGMETRYFLETKWYPQAIKDTVAHQFPKHKITSIYVRNVKGKSTYQARVARTKGFFRKKESDVKLLNFETDNKFIDVVDEM